MFAGEEKCGTRDFSRVDRHFCRVSNPAQHHPRARRNGRLAGDFHGLQPLPRHAGRAADLPRLVPESGLHAAQNVPAGDDGPEPHDRLRTGAPTQDFFVKQSARRPVAAHIHPAGGAVQPHGKRARLVKNQLQFQKIHQVQTAQVQRDFVGGLGGDQRAKFFHFFVILHSFLPLFSTVYHSAFVEKGRILSNGKIFLDFQSKNSLCNKKKSHTIAALSALFFAPKTAKNPAVAGKVEGDTLNIKSPAQKNATGGIAMEKTENLKLNVWEKSDPIHAKDFNDNFQTLDSAVGSLQGEHIYVGSYTGDDMQSRTIDLPWEPTFMVILGNILDHDAVSLMTATTHRYVDKNGPGFENTYHPVLNGKQLVIKNKYWFNRGNQKVQYILFR